MPTIQTRQRRVGLSLGLAVSGHDVSGSTFAESTKTLNVSGGGLCFETSTPLSIGSHLSLHIQVPPKLRPHFRGRGVYRVKAVVCRIERFEAERTSRVGVRFLGEIEA